MPDMRVPDMTVCRLFSATNTNMLAGTVLETIPTKGVLLIAIGSSVNTATVSINAGALGVANTDNIQLWSNGVPPLDQAVIYRVPVGQGVKPIVALGGTTGNVYLVAMFYAE